MQAYRWIIDSRDQYTEERLEKISGQKLERCYQIGACSLTCPKGKLNKLSLGLDPRFAIEKLKVIYYDYKRLKSENINQI
jgi:succinate dehydrogenase (ubiquinone) iron-sulfur subunit